MVPPPDVLESPAVRLMLRTLEHGSHDQSTHGRKKPRLPGGSKVPTAPTKSVPRPVSGRPSLNVLFGPDGRKPTARQAKAAKAVYEGTFAGLSTSGVTIADASPDFVRVRGTVRDKTGREVGKFERALWRTEDGKSVAKHVSMELDPSVQGQGFAQEFNTSLTDWYRANGVDEVRLFANYDVGGYAWARAGYDWGDEDGPAAVRKLLRQAIIGNSMLRGVPPERLDEQKSLAEAMLARIDSTEFGSADFPTPYEIAMLGRWPGAGKDDSWAGKAVLLASSWEAVKPL